MRLPLLSLACVLASLAAAEPAATPLYARGALDVDLAAVHGGDGLRTSLGEDGLRELVRRLRGIEFVVIDATEQRSDADHRIFAAAEPKVFIAPGAGLGEVRVGDRRVRPAIASVTVMGSHTADAVAPASRNLNVIVDLTLPGWSPAPGVTAEEFSFAIVVSYTLDGDRGTVAAKAFVPPPQQPAPAR